MSRPRKMKRSCNGCTLCCFSMALAPLNKAPSTDCQFCQGFKCTLHKDYKRPQECEDFECEWLRGLVPIEMKPDKVDFFIIADYNHNRISVIVDARKPNAWKEGPGSEYLNELAKHVILTVYCGNECFVTYTGTDENVKRQIVMTMQRLGVIKGASDFKELTQLH